MAKAKVKTDKVKVALSKDKRLKLNEDIITYNGLNVINLSTRSIAYKGWFKSDLDIYHKMSELFGKTLQKSSEDEYIRFVIEVLNYIDSIPKFEFTINEKND